MKLAALDVLASSGKITSDKLKTTLLAMLKTDDPKSRQALLQTIAEARLTIAVPVLLAHLAAAKEDALKLALVRTLGQLSDRAAFEPLKAFIKAKDPALRIEVLRALSNIDNRPARKIAESLLTDDDVQVQREAVVLLGQSVEGARLLGQQFAAKKLPRTLLPEVAEALRHFTKEHPDLNELLSRVVKGGLLVSLEPQELARVSALVRTKGDPIRGRQLYLNNKAVACISCHRLEGVGGNVGPDLTRMWDTLSLEKVMESMLDPSKEIKEGYQSYVAVKKNGQIVSGLKVAQNDKELVLKDATGKEVRIPAADLDEVAASKKSLMPDDVVRHLSFGEFIDLVAFLRDRKAQEELRGIILSAWVLGPLDFEFTKSYPFEKNVNPDVPYETPEKTRLSWKPIQADMGGKGFDLRSMLANAPGSVYLLAYVYSPKEQKVSLQHQTEEKLQLWLNGKSVEGKDEMTPLRLQSGWNVLLLRMNNEAQYMHLQARLLGGEGLRVSLAKD
jgi:putative heme-binding domain-containing protein